MGLGTGREPKAPDLESALASWPWASSRLGFLSLLFPFVTNTMALPLLFSELSTPLDNPLWGRSLCQVEELRLTEVSRRQRRKQRALRQPRLAVPGEPLLKAAPETGAPPASECLRHTSVWH